MKRRTQKLNKAQDMGLLTSEARAFESKACEIVLQIFGDPAREEMVAFLAHSVVDGVLTLEDLGGEP